MNISVKSSLEHDQDFTTNNLRSLIAQSGALSEAIYLVLSGMRVKHNRKNSKLIETLLPIGCVYVFVYRLILLELVV